MKINYVKPATPQSNGKVERVIGTLKSMLKHTVAAAAAEQGPEKISSGDIKVVGIGLDLDSTILDIIAAAQVVSRGEEVDKVPVVDRAIYWSPLLHTVL